MMSVPFRDQKLTRIEKQAVRQRVRGLPSNSSTSLDLGNDWVDLQIKNVPVLGIFGLRTVKVDHNRTVIEWSSPFGRR